MQTNVTQAQSTIGPNGETQVGHPINFYDQTDAMTGVGMPVVGHGQADTDKDLNEREEFNSEEAAEMAR